MAAVEIPSASSAAMLRFSDFDGSYFTAALTSPNLSAEVRVYVVPVEGVNDVAALVRLFKTMSEKWRGWEGELVWGSLEGEFDIVVTSDRLGHINLRLGFREYAGPAPWSAKMDFALEPIQIAEAHKKLSRFFS